MSFLSDFEGRISSVFGAAPQGYTEPFSFKKLAKRAAREMETETYEIDGVDTAPALYTVLVSATDDSLMRPLYEQITLETASFVTAQAQKKGYAFVGNPLVRFMVDPSLKPGKFAVFAENIDASTLNRLREEERAFLAGSSSAGGAAAQAPSAVIGRERSQASIVLRDPNVSRSHAELTHDGTGWRITDLNSTNGTLVNDVDVTSCPLQDGDLITVGLVNLEFREIRR